MEGIGRTTGEIGIPGTHVAAMNESDETHLGETEKKTGIGTSGTRGMSRRVRMQSTVQRGLVSGVCRWIQSPGRQGNPQNRNHTVRTYSLGQ